MLSLGCGSIEDLRRELLELRAELDDPVKFRAVYRFAYGFSLEPGIKCLPLDVAVSMWRLLFSESRWPLLDDWCDFLEGSGAQTISRDTWNQLLPFIEVWPGCDPEKPRAVGTRRGGAEPTRTSRAAARRGWRPAGPHMWAGRAKRRRATGRTRL